jgi:hypothetical protein
MPNGLCECGCGQQTSLATFTNANAGIFKGQPRRFKQGHSPRYPRRTEPQICVIDRRTCGVVPLTRGASAIVNIEDYPEIMKFSWQVSTPSKNGHTRYAYRRATKADGHTGKDKRIWMHRAICKPKEEEEVDHRNRNGLDNRRQNLRVCERTQNTHNTQPRSDNQNGFKNVTQRPNGKFRARGRKDGKRFHIGDFSTAEQAAKAADEFAHSADSEFSFLNFPQ